MTIFQPRRDNVSTYTISKDELLKWADEILAPTAQLAYVGEGEFKAGDHCQFCKVKATCRKRAEYNLELAKYDFEMPATLDDIEIAAILAKVDEMISWGNDIKEYALQQAQSGVHFDGWKIVEGRSNRKFTDEAAVASKVKDAGYDPYEKKLLGMEYNPRPLYFECNLQSSLVTLPQFEPSSDDQWYTPKHRYPLFHSR